MKEIKRVEGFESGDTECIRCGRRLHLHFNGGELDREECCGLVYATESVRIDLVVYEKGVVFENCTFTNDPPREIKLDGE